MCLSNFNLIEIQKTLDIQVDKSSKLYSLMLEIDKILKSKKNLFEH